jgi:RHS repeat-associated protein
LAIVALISGIGFTYPSAVRAQHGGVGPDCLGGCGGSYSVSVDFAESNPLGRVIGTSPTDSFLVDNTGNTDTYLFHCSTTGGLGCISVNPSSATITGHTAIYVKVTYSVAVPSGTLKLVASGEAVDSAKYTVTENPTITLVAPVLTSGSRAVVHNRQPRIEATFVPNGSPVNTAATVLVWGSDTVTALSRANTGVLEWEVDSTHWLGVGDSALVTVRACSQDGACGTVTRWAVLLNDHKPVVGFSGMPLEALGRQFTAPFGPGLSLSGADVETGFALPGHITMGTPRSVSLVYSTRQSYPRVLVPVDVELPWPNGTPTKVHVSLFDTAGTRMDSLVVTSPSCVTGSAPRCRAVLEADFSAQSFTTPTREWLTVQIQVDSGSTTQFGSDSVEVVVVDRRATPYGSGWWLGGVPKLVNAGSDRVLVAPNGAAAVYRGVGDSVYISPPADLSVLTKISSGWQLSPLGSTAKLVFDASGRLLKSVDRNGNRDTVVYNGSTDQVIKFIDPQGKKDSLAYDDNGKLARITDPAGRQSRVTIDGTTKQLKSDSITSPSARTDTTAYVYQTYPGANTAALLRRIGVIGDTTTVIYDSTFLRRPVQVQVPRVQDENGNSVTPTVSYKAYEGRGYGGLVSLDSVYVEMKDARNNWTRSLLNRWAQARKTWDTLGTLGRVEYTPEGFVLWSEGKVADSSRVYHTYDLLRRLASSYIVRAANDTLRLEALSYAGSSLLLSQRTDARGKSAYFSYDSNGNQTLAVTPNGDTTRTVYRSDGLPDSTRLPGNTAWQHFTWESTWKNLQYATDESGTILDRHTYDGLGRDSVVERKVRVQVTSSTSQWQWRKTQVYFNVAGQADSSALWRTDNCADPCNTPTYTTSVRVRHRFDRAGRDSLRINDAGHAVLYLYDRLGRLVSRHPWTDSMAVRDSSVYDVVGNVKKTITRRGDTLTTNYDSRNRDTLTAVPGVGTLRKAYAGSADQLTRLWFDSPTDSMGGVSAEVRWGYDQHGRLKADTAFAGSVAEATSHTYDHYERDSTATDPLGVWATRYETNRGLADTLITPLGDTVTYAFDGQARGVGPDIRSGGPLQSARPAWSATGSLDTLTRSVATTPSFTPLKFVRKQFPDEVTPYLVPEWTEQEGSGASASTLVDSVVYDGWQRVVAWIALKSGVEVARDTFSFSSTGDIFTTQSHAYPLRSYDDPTSRLISRCGTHTWRYVYDRTGNLTQARDSVSGSLTVWDYGYDALNRLTSVRCGGSLIARYAYDVLGRRIAKRVYSSATGGTVGYTRFVYHGDAVAFETDSAGSTIGLRYTWGPGTDNLLAVTDAAGNHFYVVSDMLGSVRGLVKRDGTWVLSQRFDPYGAVVSRDTSASGPGFALRYGWAGREYDPETGWHYFRARYYDLNAQRFVQEDPLGYDGGSNLYAYVDGDALEARDPSGMMECLDYCPGAGGGFKKGPRLLGTGGGGVGGNNYGGVEGSPGDWDGNGYDEFAGFADYAFERQTNPGGSHEAFDAKYSAAQDGLAPRTPSVYQLASIVFNETRGVDEEDDDLSIAREAMADVVVNRWAVGYVKGTAPAFLTREAAASIRLGGRDAVTFAGSVGAAVEALNGPDITDGATRFNFQTTDSLHGSGGMIFGPYTQGAGGDVSAQGGQIYLHIWGR